MRPWWRTRAFIAGVVLVLIANAVALGGVAWNRGGEPDSVLLLDARELPLAWYRPGEDSALALRLAWRVAPSPAGGAAGQPAWLDEVKLRALGFHLPPPAADPATRHRLGLAREVVLVLEYNGAAAAQALAAAEAELARALQRAAAQPADEGLAAGVRHAQEQLVYERTQASRLFVVDAGRDARALRAQYPDRGRYLLLPGTVQPSFHDDAGRPRLGGYVSAVLIERIHVPAPWRAALQAQVGAERPQYRVQLATGHRLEPWILDVAQTRE